MKMKNVEQNEVTTNEDTQENPEQDVKDSLDSIPYNKCIEWTVDNSVFDLPT